MKGIGKAYGENESMRQFNYYGQTRLENLDEHDVVGLEREIDFIIRNSALGDGPVRGQTAGPMGNHIDPNIVNIDGSLGNQLPPRRQAQTAGHGTRSKKRGAKSRKNRA